MKSVNRVSIFWILVSAIFVWLSPLKGDGEQTLSVKAFVTNEKIMGGGASIMYWVTNKTDAPIRVPLDWFYDGQKYIEIRSTQGIVHSMPGGDLDDNSEKSITIDSGAVVVILGAVPMNEVFLKRQAGVYTIKHSILGDVIKPFKIENGVIYDSEVDKPAEK